MKIWKAFGEAVALGSILLWIVTYLIITVVGLSGNGYRVVVDTNMFYEHYIELGIFVVGLVAYISCHHIKLRTKKPQKG